MVKNTQKETCINDFLSNFQMSIESCNGKLISLDCLYQLLNTCHAWDHVSDKLKKELVLDLCDWIKKRESHALLTLAISILTLDTVFKELLRHEHVLFSLFSEIAESSNEEIDFNHTALIYKFATTSQNVHEFFEMPKKDMDQDLQDFLLSHLTNDWDKRVSQLIVFLLEDFIHALESNEEK